MTFGTWANNKTTKTMPRLTKKKFISLLNEKFKELEIFGYEVIDLYSTRLRSDDYEAGAAKIVVTFQNIDTKSTGHFFASYSLKEYEKYLNDGYEIVITFKNHFQTLSDIDVDVRR